MNAEKVYAVAVMALRRNLSDFADTVEGFEKLCDKALNNPEDFKAMPTVYELGMLAREAKEEIAKKDGRKDVLAACKSILKSSKRQSREALHGAWIDGDGWQNVSDGYRAVRMEKHIDALPSAEGFERMADIFKRARENNTEEMKLPTIGEVKAVIAAKKAKGQKDKFVYDFGEDMPAVDANFLIDLLRLGASDTAMIAKKGPMINPIYVAGDGIEAVLLPVRKEQKNEQED